MPRAWVAAHDGEKVVSGIGTWGIRTASWEAEEVRCLLIELVTELEEAEGSRDEGKSRGTKVVKLAAGDCLVIKGEEALISRMLDTNDRNAAELEK